MRKIIKTRYFWIVVFMLAISAFLHYFTPQLRFPPLMSFPLTRHGVERIMFILPIAGAAFAFGQTGGLIALTVAVLIMLPRVFFISAYPIDSFVETIGVAVVGYAVVWMIETQEREKKLHREAVSRLGVINAIGALVTRSLELKRILSDVLDRILEVMDVEAVWVYLVDEKSQELVFEAHRGLSEGFVATVKRLKVGEGFNGQVAHSGKPLLVDNASEVEVPDKEAVQLEGLQALCIVPLRSRDKVMGTLGVATRGLRFLPEEVDLLNVIGGQIGAAVENARLYENMRFYVSQTIRAQEDERKRIARELHDDTAQALIALSRRLDDLTTGDEQLSEFAVEQLEKFQELIDSILQGVRRFSRALRPSVLDDLGLLPALEGLMADAEAGGIETHLQIRGDRFRLAPETELVLFRIVQEALSNVRRHSQASQVVIVVEFGEDRVRITVEDNGQGFDLPGRTGNLAARGKLGLVGMRERAQLLGGTVAVQSELGKGTTVAVEVPL